MAQSEFPTDKIETDRCTQYRPGQGLNAIMLHIDAHSEELSRLFASGDLNPACRPRHIAKTAKEEIAMAITTPNIDLTFRPTGYFWPLDLQTHVVSSIKGAERKSVARMLFAEGCENEIPPDFIQSALTDEHRKFRGLIHPSLMGGEYLPDREPEEVEIARITIASSTQDVTSVYASRGKDQIGYRVVDEYDGETLSGEANCSSRLPLTLGELTAYFLEAWDLLDVLKFNFEGDYENVHGFFEGTSEFYPDFGKLVRHRVDEWLQEQPSSLYEDDEENDEENPGQQYE